MKITQKRAEIIRKEVKQLKIPYQEQLLENVTLSLGVAVFPIHGSTRDEILKAADEALYQAKAEGRDCVIVKSLDNEGTAHG